MKIAPAQTERFISSSPKEVAFFLIYGPEQGQAAILAKKLQAQHSSPEDPFSVTTLDFDKINEDPALLADEMASISFFGGKKFIRIENAGVSLPKPLEAIFAKGSADAKVVIVAEELTPASSLRKFFESSPNAAAIVCYKEEAGDIVPLIERTMREHGKQLDRETILYLANALGKNRLLIHSELEKLALFMGNRARIDLKEVERLIENSSETALDALCNAIADADSKKAQQTIDRLFSEAIVPAVLCRTIERYFGRILSIHAAMQEGKSLEMAVSGLQPPIFFKQVPNFKRHVTTWKPKNILELFNRLARWEQEVKTTASPSELVSKYFVEIVFPKTK